MIEYEYTLSAFQEITSSTRKDKANALITVHVIYNSQYNVITDESSDSI